MLTPDSIPKIKSNVVGRIVDNEAVVVLPEKGKVEVFNEVGAFIWEKSDGSHSAQQIAAAICDEFDVGIDQALEDTLAFLDDLFQRVRVGTPVVIVADAAESEPLSLPVQLLSP